MNLETNSVLLILACAVVLIGGVFVLLRRGTFGGAKATEQTTPAGKS